MIRHPRENGNLIGRKTEAFIFFIPKSGPVWNTPVIEVRAMNRIILLCFLATGCSAMQNPNIWAPVAVAAALQVNDMDEQISDELSENTPVFGSNDSAGDWSDNLELATTASYIAAGVYIPDLGAGGKAKLIGVQTLSVVAVHYVTGEIKDATDRERPDESGDDSMPSRHTTMAAYQAQLAGANIDRLDASSDTKRNLRLSVNATAAMSGYARIEAGKHYPSDVLIGWSLGNLFAYTAKDTVVMPSVSRDSVGVSLSFNFY